MKAKTIRKSNLYSNENCSGALDMKYHHRRNNRDYYYTHVLYRTHNLFFIHMY